MSLEADITLLQYFAANAPHEPQPWFKPVTAPRPIIPTEMSLTRDQRCQWGQLGDTLEDSDVEPAVLAFRDKREAALEAAAEWDAELQKQSYVQWPWAWAAAVLQAGPQ
jgi:hypothetical protein